MLPGDREAGAYLVRHPQVDKIAFTGSTAAGRQIMADCAPRIARVTLELGGKSAAIVLDDADIESVVRTVIPMAFTVAGVGDEGLVPADDQLAAGGGNGGGDRLRSDPTSGSVSARAAMASSAATAGSQRLRTASLPPSERAKLPMPCIANSESRCPLTLASASRTTVTARVSSSPPEARAQPAARENDSRPPPRRSRRGPRRAGGGSRARGLGPHR